MYIRYIKTALFCTAKNDLFALHYFKIMNKYVNLTVIEIEMLNKYF